ncbi:MAG: hypothetical protein MUD12_08235 [Spirochaetes bacterium]|jgi:hypothetical protein|nr:hypothetical protein [Spirochaetota bacterium]
MEIKDIIKTDSDRLFIVDPECFIIFTGDSIEDIRPFIRIGNWLNIPVELIPLIENIIITDHVIGNPAHEQFNIDITNLASNKYIGSRNIVKRYLDFQKVFSLDLKNASIVDIEKDIPELSREQYISANDQFIGVFYRDGNFKIVKNAKTILDIKEVGREFPDFPAMITSLSEKNAAAGRYGGAGMTLQGRNPFFYQGGTFAAYMMPQNMLDSFSRLEIDPSAIKELIYPSSNIINLAMFYKWADTRKARLRMMVKNRDILVPAGRLFSSASVKLEGFDGFSIKTEKGLAIKNYTRSFNLRAVFSTAGRDKITAAYVKGSVGIKKVLADDLDLIFMEFSVYEECSMLLKSVTAPVIVIDDGSKNLPKMVEARPVIGPGFQYEITRISSAREAFSLAFADGEFSGEDAGDRIIGELEKTRDNPEAGSEGLIRAFNLSSLADIVLSETADRKKTGRIKKALYETAARYDLLKSSAGKTGRVIIALYGGGAYPILAGSAVPGTAFLDEIGCFDGQRMDLDPAAFGLYKKIRTDRERLRMLLDLFRESSKSFSERTGDIEKLRESMERRRDALLREGIEDAGYPVEYVESVLRSGDDKAAAAGRGDEATGRTLLKKIAGKKHFKPLLAALLVIAAVAALIIFLFMETGPSRIAKHDESNFFDKKKIMAINEGINIAVSDTDIFNYANSVAMKNGYNRISFSKIKIKNPDWIYPGNVFTMLDGQGVKVSHGDTLWDLSKYKLVEMKMNLNRALEKINTSSGDGRKALIHEARKYAFSKKDINTLNELESGTDKKK